MIKEEEKESSVMSLSDIAKIENSYQEMKPVDLEVSENSVEGYWAGLFANFQKKEEDIAVPKNLESIS